MKRPCLAATGLDPNQARSGNVIETVMTKIAWLGDNFDYSNREQAQKIIIECIRLLRSSLEP